MLTNLYIPLKYNVYITFMNYSQLCHRRSYISMHYNKYF